MSTSKSRPVAKRVTWSIYFGKPRFRERSGEGPFDTKTEAVEFASAEAGLPWSVRKTGSKLQHQRPARRRRRAIHCRAEEKGARPNSEGPCGAPRQGRCSESQGAWGRRGQGRRGRGAQERHRGRRESRQNASRLEGRYRVRGCGRGGGVPLRLLPGVHAGGRQAHRGDSQETVEELFLAPAVTFRLRIRNIEDRMC